MAVVIDSTGDRWGRVPAWWLDHPGLDADGFAVLAALATFADENGLCWPSQSTLATKLKRSRPTINRILQSLSDLGLVVIERRLGRDGSRLSCLYRLRLTHDGKVTAATQAVGAVDRDDSSTNIPCPPASQEQLHSEQIPDSLTRREPEPVHVISPDWVPDSEDLAWAHRRFGEIDLDRHIESFVLRCQAHGYRYRDIGAAWRSWLLQDTTAGKAPMTKTNASTGAATTAMRHPRENPVEQRIKAWVAVAQRLQNASSPSPARP